LVVLDFFYDNFRLARNAVRVSMKMAEIK